ncbi:hypothetical protein PEM37_00135 [Streptomyces sp. AD681]|nr:hypothetical protein [Streptomyces sp. AD681]MDA5139897.1 hypothetical protein [Streptomyces sp. AD681]
MAVDGKTLHRAARAMGRKFHLLTAFDHLSGLILAQSRSLAHKARVSSTE